MRLIDADKAVEQIKEWLHQTRAIPLDTSYHFELLGCVENCPTIDAVPVVRGEWKLYGNDDDSGMSYWCTVCNFQLSEDLFYSGYKNGRWIENGVFKYCPNCGAKMEVEHGCENKLIVRCKDCKHYNTIGCSKGFGWCENIDRGTSDNFYCANGKQLNKESEVI
jgi:hypothetical protein